MHLGLYDFVLLVLLAIQQRVSVEYNIIHTFELLFSIDYPVALVLSRHRSDEALVTKASVALLAEELVWGVMSPTNIIVLLSILCLIDQ